ncbi:alpha-ketoacid dehydrogenase subunit beta [Candidatus Poribacteria bacterium]|nr:alpha-ketoacid dehydrogenase subunit beta [Candidatus Poribacteria bacterium]
MMKTITYRDALKEALREEMQRDEKVFLMGEDIAEYGGAYKVTDGLFREFGKERVRNTPISEAAIIGTALGAAITGMRPVAELMYIDFTGVSMDQIVNQVAKIRYMVGGQLNVPLVIRTQGGAGRSSAAQHAQSLEAWFAHVPGLLVVMPSTPYDAKGLLKTAIRDDNPVMFIEHKLLYTEEGEIPEEEYTIPFGVADIKREGEDLTIVATSRMVLHTLAAAEELADEGIEAEVIDPRTLMPLDKETILDSVRKTNRLLIAHEAVGRGGFGAEIAALAAREAFDYLDAPIERVAAAPVPVPFAPVMEKFVIPDKDDIIESARRLVRYEI